MPDTPTTNEPVATGDEARRRSLIDDMSQASEQARDYIAAEIEFQKARAIHAGAGIRTIAVLLLVALVLVAFGLFGLIISAIMALAQVMPIWTAALIVGGGLVIVAAMLTTMAIGHWRSLRRDLRASDKRT